MTSDTEDAERDSEKNHAPDDESFRRSIGLTPEKPLPFIPRNPIHRPLGRFRIRMRRLPSMPAEVDVSLLSIAFISIAAFFFVAFDVATTFPLSIKFLMLCGESFAVGLALLVFALWKQRTP